jgi:hypothetical protein
MASQRMNHSSIVGACCKSKTSTQVPSTVLSQFWKEKKQNLPRKFHAGAGIKQNQLLLPFPRTTKMNVLGHHYFAQKRRETSQIKFKPALHSLSQGFGLSGGHATFGDEPLTPLRQTFFLFDCLVSPPTPYLWMGGLTKPPLVA